MIIRLFAVALLGLAVAGCSKDSDKSNRQAPRAIEESLTPATGLGQEDGLIRLRKTSLGKAFLMSPTMVIATTSPILDTLQPLVVTFERSGQNLGLFEQNLNTYYSNLPSDRLLQTFVIERETKDDLFFRWNYGLDFISQRANDYMSDAPAGEQQDEMDRTEETVFPAVKSFVRKVAIEDNTLLIEQVSRLRNQTIRLSLPGLQQGQPAEINSTDLTIQLNVRIRPYVMNKNFRAKESEFTKGIGFFEQYTWNRDDGRIAILARRWDLDPSRGPLVYAITKNTPPEMVEAVREGVLYWNIVLGREAIKVETGADPREPSRDRRVIVHWIDWPGAGFARAAMQSDPLTGELIGGNVYMTSVFAVSSRMSARQEGRRADKPLLTAVPAGFKPSQACLKPLDLERESVFSAAVPNEEAVRRFAADVVRSTVAHEVGHTLGLRHNFAGNLGTKVPDWAAQRRLEKEYLANGLPGGFATNSTVMDYSFNLDTAILGSFIRHDGLAYDIAAMKWGASGAEVTAASVQAPPFCSDGHINDARPILGCERFDGGLNPLRTKAELIAVGRDNLMIRLARSLITFLHPLKAADKKSPDELRQWLNEQKLEARLARVFQPAAGVREALVPGAEHWLTRQELGAPGWLNEEAWTARNRELVGREWAMAGGLAGFIEKALVFENGALVTDSFAKDVSRVLENPELSGGISLEGVAYQLTADERALVTELLQAFARAAERQYVLSAIGKLSYPAGAKMGTEPVVFDASILPADDEAKLGDLAAGVILPSDETRGVGVGETVVQVPVPRHEAAVRLASLRWVAPKLFGRAGWAAAAREKIRAELVRRLRLVGAVGENAEALKGSLPGLPLKDDARAFAAGELAVLGALENLAKE